MTRHDESTEDAQTVEQFLQHMPALEPGFRHQLRSQLATMAVPPPHPRATHRRRWGAVLAAAALCAAAAVALAWSQRTAAPANAYQILQSALQAVSAPANYTGAMLVTYRSPPDAAAPLSVARPVDTYHLRARFWVANPTHYRIDVYTRQPALQRGTQVLVVNGRTATVYDSTLRLAIRGPFDSSPRAVLFNLLLPRQSVRQYLYAVRHSNPAARARIVGHATLLGQQTDEVQFGPLGRADSCRLVGPPPHPVSRCTHRFYGWARAWISRATHMVLRYEEHSVPLSSGQGAQFVAHVTRLTVDPEAVHTSLAYRAPRRPQRVPAVITVTAGGAGYSTAGLLFDVQERREVAGFPHVVPSGFAVIPPWLGRGPKHQPQPLPVAYGIQQGPLRGMTIHVGYLYARHLSLGSSTTSYAPLAPTQALSASILLHGAGVDIHGRWVYLEEQRRLDGLPAALQAGVRYGFGLCSAWSGRYSNGQVWVALRHGTVAILAVSNGMTERNLARYARERLCP